MATPLTATISGQFVRPDNGKASMTAYIEAASSASLLTFSGGVIASKTPVKLQADGSASVTIWQLPQAGIAPSDARWRLVMESGQNQYVKEFTLTADLTWDDLVDVSGIPVTPDLLLAAQQARDAAIAAAAAVAYSTWQATTAYVSGQTVQAPDGSLIKANSSRTSRASFDATEQTFWTLVATKSGTLEQVGLDNAYPARVTPVKDAPAFGLYFPEANGGVVGAGHDSAAIQAAIDRARAANGGKVWCARATGYDIDAPLTHPSRVRIEGLSASGDVKLRAVNGLNKSMIYIGATDGTDPNWHWAELSHVYLDGNKANQTRPAAKTIDQATTVGYVATFRTTANHNLTIGAFTEIAGMTPAGYNGRWRVESVPDATHFTVQHLTNALGAGSVFGTSRELLNCVNVGKGGEASSIHHVYTTGAVNNGFIQGTTGTPMDYQNCSAFSHGDWGFDLWCDRPIMLGTPSGDLNGLGLIRAAGTASAGGTGTDSVITIHNVKAEHHTVPAITLDDFDGAVNLTGGSIDMETTNTGPCIRRTAKSNTSELYVKGVSMNPHTTGGAVVFEDLTTSARNVGTTATGSETYTFDICKSPRGFTRFTQFRNDLTDASSVVTNLQNGTICKLTIGATPRTISIPTNRPVGSPNAERLVYDIKNNTAGAIAITWDAIFVMSTWTNPAAGKRKTIEFWWDGTNYVQVGTPSPDMP